MKKNLIALAVVASAAVSGSAMAAGWEQNGTGGTFDMGGALTPVDKLTPWEVKVGDAVNGLNALVAKGSRNIEIQLTHPVEVLGIRNYSTTGFRGGLGIKPQIDYGAAVNVNGFNAGVTTVTLNVKDGNDTSRKIGTMTADFAAMAVSGWMEDSGRYGKKILVADSNSGAFYGGLPKTPEKSSDVRNYFAGVHIDLQSKFNMPADTSWDNRGPETFGSTTATFFGWYGSVISNKTPVKIKLDNPVAGDAEIPWKASLPVTVTYM